MPNIFKVFSKAKAEPYQFPNADELVVETPPEPEEELPAQEGGEFTEGTEDAPDGAADGQAAEAEPEAEPEESAITFAQVQAEAILAEARQNAERILDQAREEADQRAEEVFAKARENGYQDGYVAGMAQASQEAALAAEEAVQKREEQARQLEEEVHHFLERAGAALDRQMDESVADLRDLAMAVAEKVVCVSLKSSADVICRMIQTAIDKKKKKEWVHIYIAECDAKRLSQLPGSLTNALSALSDRVRIIPMAGDQSGTCIIEMPDEIVDASSDTQLNNLRTILMDTANSASGMNLF